MTIGLGVLCSTHNEYDDLTRMRPDAMVFVADTMGSTDTDSTAELHKLFYDRRANVYGVGCGNMDIAAEMFGSISDNLANAPEPRNHGVIWNTLGRVVNGHRSERFMFDVAAPRYMFTPQHIPQTEMKSFLAEWQAYYVGADLLIGTFDYRGMALLYFIGNQENTPGLVHLVQFPGYCAIGAGLYNASMWLNYRGQNFGMNIQRSALHALESANMAASAPSVNASPEMLLATSSDCWEISRRRETDNPPITMEELKRLVKKHAPRSTHAVGTFSSATPPDPQSTRGDQ